MKKIISFSLWGDNPKYTIGAIRNAELAAIIYSGWTCRYYIGSSTPEEIINKLSNKTNVEIIKMNESGEWNSMFWRFFPASEDDVEIMISRDCDSRLSEREKLCVDEWIKSDKKFHCMIDHPFHSGIMGGMWGVKRGLINDIKTLIDKWPKSNKWQTDQSFLNTAIAPIALNNTIIHDSIRLKNFLSKRENYHFIGEIFDEHDQRHEQYCVLQLPEYKDL
jgi:hypothetical protein